MPRTWAERLLGLHRNGELKEPLIGSVQSTLYIYRRKKDDDDDSDPAIVRRSIKSDHGLVHQDIFCHFKAEVYPDNPMKDVQLLWRDILGENPPEAFSARDLKSHFRIDLEQFHESIKEAIEDQLIVNARQRAVTILDRRAVRGSYLRRSPLANANDLELD